METPLATWLIHWPQLWVPVMDVTGTAATSDEPERKRNGVDRDSFMMGGVISDAGQVTDHTVK
jgi:hypothetical protein